MGLVTHLRDKHYETTSTTQNVTPITSIVSGAAHVVVDIVLDNTLSLSLVLEDVGLVVGVTVGAHNRTEMLRLRGVMLTILRLLSSDF